MPVTEAVLMIVTLLIAGAMAGLTAGLFGNGGGFVSAFFDEVAFWDTALPADDIGTIYNSGNGTFDLTSDFGSYNSSSNLQHYFRFENNYTDTKGNASDATTEGSPVFSTSPTPP